jgi:glutamate/tyrosine decarboxylase-like PLP-dependent enzyme
VTAGDLAGRQALLQDASRRAEAYLAGLAGRAVAPLPAAVQALDALDFPLPASGRPAPEVLALLDDVGSPGTVGSAGPRYFGFVTGGALPVAVAAAWLTDAWDQNAGLAVMSPTAARLDAIALRWVAEVLGLPAGTGGGFVTGATMANASCLAAPATRCWPAVAGTPRARDWSARRQSPSWPEPRCTRRSARRSA